MADDSMSRGKASATLQKVVKFYRENVGVSGGYVYRVSHDLSQREGENRVGAREVWIEPPATPAVGMAYLNAYQLTGERIFLDAMLETADALIRGQLESGGWANNIEFDPLLRSRYAYRVDHRTHLEKRFNRTTFDDNKSQSCALFLILVDKELSFQNAAIHEAALFALESFVKAQYPNGAWPQQFNEPPDADDSPSQEASLPKTWNRQYEKISYSRFYTLNDGTISDLIELMLVAHEVYNDPQWLDSAKRGGDFLLLAQLPEPQPGWAQQYNSKMQPAWARKFEPPAITGGESQGVLNTLMTVYEQTGEKKYLEPIPRALEYYNSLLLPNGQLARFYEMETDRPLYFTRDYKLVYTDDDLPTHYGFKVGSKLDRLQQRYDRLNKSDWSKPALVERPKISKRSNSIDQRAFEAISSLDKRGAWVEEGLLRNFDADDQSGKVIDTRTYVRNLAAIAEFLASSK